MEKRGLTYRGILNKRVYYSVEELQVKYMDFVDFKINSLTRLNCIDLLSRVLVSCKFSNSIQASITIGR